MALAFYPVLLLLAVALWLAPSTILRMVPLPRWGRIWCLTIPGLPSGRFGFCIGWPTRGTCGRRVRRWGCLGSRPICCGGGTLCLRRGGTRRWCWRWRGGMSRKCWRRGRSMGWRRPSFIMVSRWRCGGGSMRGCCWRIWRGSTGRRRRPRRALMPSGSTKCWRWWRARCRRSWLCWTARMRARRYRRSGRAMWRNWARRWRRTSARLGSMRWMPGRKPVIGRCSIWRRVALWQRASGMRGRAGRRRAWTGCWPGKVRRWSSSPRIGLDGFALDRVNCVNRTTRRAREKISASGNSMVLAVFLWVKAGAVLPPPPSVTASA